MLFLILLLIILAIVSLFLGRYPDTGFIGLKQLAGDDLARLLILKLRLPRIMMAILLGASLAAAGTIFQMLFANPIVEPGFLGVSQGAAFGAALTILFFGSAVWIIQIVSAVFAILGLILSYIIARRIRYGGWILRLILSGIAVSALFTSGIGILKYMADPLTQLPEIVFWILGGLWNISWDEMRIVLPVVLICLFIIYRMRWRINLLSLKDETAFSMGVSPGKERLFLLTTATVVTASVIAVSGIVGWIGLIVPHLARRIFGADARYSLPGAILLGGIFGIVCDTLARVLLPGEIPLGILTSLVGALGFIFIMISKNIR